MSNDHATITKRGLTYPENCADIYVLPNDSDLGVA